jgi:hypothetical protein
MRLVLLAFAFSLLPAAAREDAPAAQRTKLPLVRAHGLLYVELAWKGEPILALLDTGANASAIDPKRPAGLKVVKEDEVLGTTGTLRAESVALEGLRFGDLALPRLVATRRDLAGLLAADERHPEMILGSDALLGCALTLDFESNELDLVPSSRVATVQADKPVSGEVAMGLDEGIPTIPATLAGLEVTLRIDTGASLFESKDVYVNVPEGVWSLLRERDPALKPSSSLRGVGADGKAVDLPVVRVGPSRVGPLDVDRAYLIVQPKAGYFALPAARGFVGVNWLEKLGRVTLDYASGRLRARSR